MYVGDEQLAVERIQNCINDIKQWMRAYKLKLNDDKTELLILSSKSRRKYINSNSVKIGISDIHVQAIGSKVRNLGIIFDDSMSMQAHVKKICQTAYFHRNINSIRKLLSQQDNDKLIHAFVSSRLNCGNALLYGIPTNLLQSLQLVQNAAARTIFMSQKFDHVPPLLGQLHWLPVEQRIMFKVCLLT